MESNENSYKLEQEGKIYILTTNIEGDSIKITCKNQSEPVQVFYRILNLESLKKLDNLFEIIKTPLEAQEWIDKALKKEKVQIVDDGSSIKMVFHITTNGVKHQLEITMAKEGENLEDKENPAEIESGALSWLTKETKSLNKTVMITVDEFNREIGLDPSIIVKQTKNADTEQIINSIEDEKRKSLASIKYDDVNVNVNTALPLSTENLDINTGNQFDINSIYETKYQTQVDNTNIIPGITTDTSSPYEGTNFDLAQLNDITEQENFAQYTDNALSLNSVFATGENNYIASDANLQFNAEDYNTTSTQDIANQFTETNLVTNTFDSAQIPLPTMPTDLTNVESQPFASSSDNFGLTDQLIATTNATDIQTDSTPLNINYENIDQGLFTQTNYGEIQTTNADNQFNFEEFINNASNVHETQIIPDYGTAQIEGDLNFTNQNIITNTEINTLTSGIDEIHALNQKLDELIALKPQLEEINNLKAKLTQININVQETKNVNEIEMLKIKIKELEELIAKYEKEILSLKESKVQANIQENSEVEKKSLSSKEITQQLNVEGDIIHTAEELELITRQINKIDKKITLNLIYKATVDSDKAAAFHEKCDAAQSSLVLVETDKGKRFGGFTTSSWSGNCVEKKDEDAFVFSLDKMKVFKNIPGEEAIGCYPKFGPIFLGCQIRIYDNFFSKECTTFEKGLNYYTEEDYELTGGDRFFNVKEIEVYEVIVE